MSHLHVRGLQVSYVAGRQLVPAVEDFNLSVAPGEVIGLAGESGSGKSTVAKAMMRILQPPGVINGGEVIWNNVDLIRLDAAALREVRWRDIAMVFQSALESLNPVMPVAEQFNDMARARLGRPFSQQELTELLAMVDLEPHVLDAYPHQLSGGMRQRVGIALALALRPKLLILDEPTTALDVVVQRNILRRLRSLQREMGFSVLFITHDLPVLFAISDRILVMKDGRVCAEGTPRELRADPKHPYAVKLLAAMDLLTSPQERP